MSHNRKLLIGVAILAICALSVPAAFAAPCTGATNEAPAFPGSDECIQDPLAIPKYVTPLVIPPVMKDADGDNLTSNYDIAVRQFKQQILPGGIWNTIVPGGTGADLPSTTVWSYGPAAEDRSAVAGLVAPNPDSQFNYPAYTIETIAQPSTGGTPVTVNWINDLLDPTDNNNFRPHILPIDQTLHWANPAAECIDGSERTDCRGTSASPYLGPVPIITHVHGAHVGPESDGYPEAWYLPNPDGSNFTTVTDPALADPNSNVYVSQGTLVNQYGTITNTPGVASFTYPNDQPSATLWYHDHSLGMTRNNVYAGPAGFWLIREAGGGETGLSAGTLPGPAPVAGDTVLELNAPGLVPGTINKRRGIREIPIVIQDRSFNVDGSLFYPGNRAFFEGLPPADLQIDFVPDSDIAPIWNPEAFFTVMVVNGVSWPELEVAPAIYRFRLLNGCNSRFLNLSMFRLNKKGNPNKEIPFFQIGAEQSLLPQAVEVVTGKATPLVAGVALWDRVNAPFKDQALLMGLAERADVLVDFRGLKNGTIIRMINTAPDAPFGGFPDVPADPATSGQVMQFRVNSALLGQSPTDPGGATPATDPWNLALSLPDSGDPANVAGVVGTPRDLALIEEESAVVCVNIDAATGAITQDDNAIVDHTVPGQCLELDTNGNPTDIVALSVPFAPKAAVLGINGMTATPTVTLWSEPIVTNPGIYDSGTGEFTAATETWELWNHTVDGHPIHLHLVKFKVVNREPFIPDPITGIPVLQGPVLPAATEAGWKDTVIAYPGEVTRVNATFDIEGLYVWHCHIVEHEDNEMMVPYYVGDPENAPAPIAFAAP